MCALDLLGIRKVAFHEAFRGKAQIERHCQSIALIEPI